MPYKPFGKIFCIILLSCGLGYFFYAEEVEDYHQSDQLTLENYIADYDEYKEKQSQEPDPLWLPILLFSLLFAVLFSFYELMGFLFGWAVFRIQDDRPPDKRYERKKTSASNVYLHRQLKDQVDNELDRGEKIQWMEQPIPKYFSRTSTPLFIFSILWTTIAVFWIIGSSGSGSTAFPLFGVLFFLIGIGMMSSPLWVYYKSCKSVYVITDQRAIIIEGGRSFTIRSYPPENLQNVFRRERKNGTGDVIISNETWKDSDGDTQKNDLGFINIQDPQKAEKMLKILAEKSTSDDGE